MLNLKDTKKRKKVMLFYNAEIVDVVSETYTLKVNNKRGFVSIFRRGWFIGKLNLKNGALWFHKEWKGQFSSDAIRNWHFCKRNKVVRSLPIED